MIPEGKSISNKIMPLYDKIKINNNNNNIINNNNKNYDISDGCIIMNTSDKENMNSFDLSYKMYIQKFY